MMTRIWLGLLCVIVTSTCLVRAAFSAEPETDNFRDVLVTAGLAPEVLAPLAADSECDAGDWQVFSQLAYRLQQFPSAQLQEWAGQEGDQPGDLVEISATVSQVEPVPTPEGVSDESTLKTLSRCRFESVDGTHGMVLVPQVPQRWQGRKVTAEPVRFLAVLLGTTPEDEQLLMASRLAWFPKSGVPSGWSLLADEGMDVSLLDEVRHRRPFVKPEVSREGEAFYQCLAALAKVDPQKLAELTRQNVAAVAKQFAAAKPALEQRVTQLRRQLSAELDSLQHESLQRQLAEARRELALANAVARQGERGLSSVAPMFLEPEEQVGKLVRIEGIARRAVRIAVENDENRSPGLAEYYELEVFTPDSQNLPVVCCVARLPEEFPLGDAIREPVRVDGVFFKCWRYHSRKNLADSGQTDRPQQLYTPVVVGGQPRLLPMPASVDSRWGVWGGVAFLAVLVALWLVMLRVGERDRQRRAADRPDRLEKLPEE